MLDDDVDRLMWHLGEEVLHGGDDSDPFRLLAIPPQAPAKVVSYSGAAATVELYADPVHGLVDNGAGKMESHAIEVI